MGLKLDLKDKKILYDLDVDTRAPFSEIARKVGLSKQAVTLRVQKMIKLGVIKKFITILDPKSLGLFPYKCYIKLQDANVMQENRILKKIASNPRVDWLVSTIGKYDLIFGAMIEDPAEFEKLYYGITRPFSRFIKEKTVTQSIATIEYNRKHLVEEGGGARKRALLGKLRNKISLDETDLKILDYISQKARASNVEITNALKISGRITSYRIKQMEKSGVIGGYRCVFDREKLQLQYYKMFLNTRGLEEKTKNRFLSYCELCPFITAYVSCIGAWDVEIEFETKSVQMFQDLVREIRNILSVELRDYDFTIIRKEIKLNYFPSAILKK